MRKALMIGGLVGLLVALVFATFAIWSGDPRWLWTGFVLFFPSFVILMATGGADDDA